jgi:hypothetical protein
VQQSKIYQKIKRVIEGSKEENFGVVVEDCGNEQKFL